MRGRGKSSRPNTGYSLKEHAEDLIALLDSLGLERVFVAGHSFGGLLGLYFAAHYPQRTLGLTMIDAAAELHPLTPLFVLLLSDRLGKWYSSQEAYLMSIRAMPFITYWDAAMEKVFLADISLQYDGSVYVRTQKLHIGQCAVAVEAVPKRAWREWALRVPGPALVLSARKPFLQGQHIVETPKALETAVLLPGGVHETVYGNHITMMFGSGAQEIAEKIIHRFASVRNSIRPNITAHELAY